MLRLLFVLMALSLAAIVQADVSIHIEDFMEDGDPGFDPLFNHDFHGYNGQNPSWTFWFEGILITSRTTDKITFNLDPGQTVSYASLDVTGGGAEVRFVGVVGELNFSNVDVPGIVSYEANSEIGPIVAIELSSWEGVFDNVTIHVVPEPSAAAACILMCLFGCITRACRWRR